MSTRDIRFLQTAVAVANIWSKDPSTKVGAVAVGETPNLVAWGYNGLPPGLKDSHERLYDRELKYKLTLHAEVNALANAKFPVHTIYVTHCPCSSCAVHLLAARSVKRVVYVSRGDEFSKRWAASNADALSLLEEGGINVESCEL